ncbi:MAG: 50S ribosomal protein L18Ae [Methanobacteriota archaeon]
MKPFRVTGHVPMGREEHKFAIEVVASDERAAREQVLSNLGSRHHVPRRLITVEATQALAADEVSDPAVRHLLGNKA